MTDINSETFMFRLFGYNHGHAPLNRVENLSTASKPGNGQFCMLD